MQNLFNKLPWWMNPKYPMGRWDYFVTCIGVTLASVIPVATIYLLGAKFINVEPSYDQFKDYWEFAQLIVLLPLYLRRLKAIKWPPTVLLGVFGIGLVVGLSGYADEPAAEGFLTLIDLLLGIVLLFAPNRVEVVREKPADA